MGIGRYLGGVKKYLASLALISPLTTCTAPERVNPNPPLQVQNLATIFTIDETDWAYRINFFNKDIAHASYEIHKLNYGLLKIALEGKSKQYADCLEKIMGERLTMKEAKTSASWLELLLRNADMKEDGILDFADLKVYWGLGNDDEKAKELHMMHLGDTLLEIIRTN